MLKAGVRSVARKQTRKALGGDNLIAALAIAAISYFIRKKI